MIESITEESALTVKVMQAIKKTKQEGKRIKNDEDRQNLEADPRHLGQLQANLRHPVLSDPTLIDIKLHLSN